MPTYHSSYTDQKCNGLTLACGTPILPLKTKIRGNAPPCKSDQKDIVDEAIEFFRANIFFKAYKHKSGADLTLCYLTIFISELIRHFAKNAKNVGDARKVVTQISLKQDFKVPGDSGFCLGGFFSAPANKQDSVNIKDWLNQVRQEMCARIIDILYLPDGSPNKWWFQFQKKKFLAIERT